MNTLTQSNHHLERLSSCLRQVAAELQRRKTCKAGTQFLDNRFLDNNFHTFLATGTPTSTADTHTVPPTSSLQQLLVAQSPLNNARQAHLHSHTTPPTTQATPTPPGNTSLSAPATSACTGRGIDPPMRCRDDIQDAADGGVCKDVQNTNGGGRFVLWDSNTNANGNALDDIDGT